MQGFDQDRIYALEQRLDRANRLIGHLMSALGSESLGEELARFEEIERRNSGPGFPRLEVDHPHRAIGGVA